MSQFLIPEDEADWQTAVAELKLIDQTIHGTGLVSASKFEFEQFLLLRVFWKQLKLENLPKLLPGIDGWILKAKTLLENYNSWNIYWQRFGSSDIGEGNFTVARYYQLQVGNTQNELNQPTLSTPIAHRTRARTLNRRLATTHLETPSKSNWIPKKSKTEEDDPEDLPDPEATPTTPTDDSPSPFREHSPTPKELENVLYPPTKDEQIVNCALVIFLNALTIPFKLANNWTLHRKAFKASFDTATFEARTDGYLDDSQGNAQAIIEVKAAKRSKALLAIEIQESAQMVAWIKSDGEQPNAPRKVYVSFDQTFFHTNVTLDTD